MDTFNWDEYFERKQNLLFKLWVEDFEIKVQQARHRELAVHLHATPYLLAQAKTNPFDAFTWSSNHIDQIFNQLESNFFVKVYDAFKMSWLLNKEKPVGKFIHSDLHELIRVYLVLLYQEANDWEMMEATDALASEYVNSRRLLRKGVIRWIIERFASERMTQFLSDKYKITVDTLCEINAFTTLNVGALYEELQEVVDLSKRENQALTQFITKHPKAVESLLPKRESTLDKLEQIHSTYNLFINQGYSHKEAVIETKKAEHISESTIYRAIRSRRK